MSADAERQQRRFEASSRILGNLVSRYWDPVVGVDIPADLIAVSIKWADDPIAALDKQASASAEVAGDVPASTDMTLGDMWLRDRAEAIEEHLSLVAKDRQSAREAIERALREVRREALEEAAHAADEMWRHYAERARLINEIGHTIRALAKDGGR